MFTVLKCAVPLIRVAAAPEPNVTKLFMSVIYGFYEYARVFVSGRLFQPILMLSGKAKAYLSLGQSTTSLRKIRKLRTKSFITLGPEANIIKLKSVLKIKTKNCQLTYS